MINISFTVTWTQIVLYFAFCGVLSILAIWLLVKVENAKNSKYK